jgi:hypothetical protein
MLGRFKSLFTPPVVHPASFRSQMSSRQYGFATQSRRSEVD